MAPRPPAAAILQPEPVDPPVLQPAGLYLELAGEDIRRRAFMLADDAGVELCLRPDMTAPVCREALKRPEWIAPFALAYDGLVFRARRERADHGGEFRQTGTEYFAPQAQSPAIDVEVLAAAIEACRAAGVEPRLRLGDARLFAAVVAAAGLGAAWETRLIRAFKRPGGVAAVLREAEAPVRRASTALGEALAALPAERGAAMIDEVLAAAAIAPIGGRTSAEIAARLREQAEAAAAPQPATETLNKLRAALALDAPPHEAFAALAKIAPGRGLEACRALWSALLARIKPPAASFSPGFGRGLAYYDGMIFELESLAGAKPDGGGLGGGGRYDNVLHALAARERPDAGWLSNWGAAGYALRTQCLAEAAGR